MMCATKSLQPGECLFTTWMRPDMADNNVSGTHDSLNPERDPLALARSFCQRVPHSRDLGMTIVPTEGRHAHMRLMPQPHLLDDAGAKTLCSSAVLSLVDSAAGLAVFVATRSLNPIATLDLRMNYLRPAPTDLAMDVSADCVAFTDDVAFVHCLVHAEGHPHPVATGDATFMRGTSVRRFDAGPPPEPMPATSSEATSRTALADNTDNTARSYADYLGLEVLAEKDGLQLRLPYQDVLIGNFLLPALHGGVLGALIEEAARVAVRTDLRETPLLRILNCNIDYHRPARPMDTFASVKIARRTRRTMLVDVVCWQSKECSPVATGRVQILLESSAVAASQPAAGTKA